MRWSLIMFHIARYPGIHDVAALDWVVWGGGAGGCIRDSKADLCLDRAGD